MNNNNYEYTPILARPDPVITIQAPEWYDIKITKEECVGDVLKVEYERTQRPYKILNR